MRYLLNVAYLLLILLALPWFLYQAVTAKKYREGFLQKFLGLVPRREGERPCVWFHAVSVGEVRALRTVLDEIRIRHPEWSCVVSTTTSTGMQTAKALYPDRLVFYCPLDFTWAVGAALRRVRPDLLALVELELWPNLVDQARRRGVRVALINGRMSPRSYRGYRRIRFFVRRVLRRVDCLAVQSEPYTQRFRDLGVPPDRITVTGSIKYDAIETDRANPRTQALGRLLGIGPQDTVFIAGSTLEPEEQVALDAYLSLKPRHPRLRLVLVPRHPERFDSVARLLDERDVAYVRRSRIRPVSTNDSQSDLEIPSPLVGEGKGGGGGSEGYPHSNPPASRGRGKNVLDSRYAAQSPESIPTNATPVILLDTLGELSALWGLAHVAFVGGSLAPRGGQNMIEPAAFGAAVLFGPNTWNFKETVDALLACGGAICVDGAAELAPAVERLLADPRPSQAMGSAARRYVVGQQGATERTVALLEKLVASKWRLWRSHTPAYNAGSETHKTLPHWIADDPSNLGPAGGTTSSRTAKR